MLISSCDTKAPFAPSLPTAAGFRVDNGILKLWTGTPCNNVTGITLTLDSGTPQSTDQTWSTPHPGVSLEHMPLLGAPTPSTPLEVRTPLPTTYDWTKATTLTLYLTAPNTHAARADIPQLLRESPQHPPDAYLFGAQGWLTPADVTRENQKTFLTICTPDPK
ncbi:hypothetical protein JOD54_006739 [Actinokineospora baliensis]|uniref:hypothetical protein n=1 Tax=Actinokineospora baliensis TaxID=547056 RepID=UPI001EF8C321|nr:hypothetical protein [Actinokineospora baliensis]MBM7776535.1 hypothetical protein [Actinokineospora baliensis]